MNKFGFHPKRKLRTDNIDVLQLLKKIADGTPFNVLCKKSSNFSKLFVFQLGETHRVTFCLFFDNFFDYLKANKRFCIIRKMKKEKRGRKWLVKESQKRKGDW